MLLRRVNNIAVYKEKHQVYVLNLFNEPRHEKLCPWENAASEGLDQPAYSRSLTIAFAVHMRHLRIQAYAKSIEWRSL